MTSVNNVNTDGLYRSAHLLTLAVVKPFAEKEGGVK
jgi:hypothetical protein